MNTHRIGIHQLGVLVAGLLCGAAWAAEEAPKIRLNTLGYLPGHEKKASIVAPCSRFAILRASDGSRVLEGTATGPVLNEDTQEQVYTADFSALKEPGEYQVDMPGVGKSARFRVAAEVYTQPFYVVVRGMYLWRCGTAVKAVYNGQTFEHGPCHMQDAWVDSITGEHVRKDGTKGWHDAGDYNKYVVNAGITVGCMFWAWEDFGPQIRQVRLDIPESGGTLPDFLAELKWELEWVLTMQAADGSVYHKLSTKAFGGFILPEQETADRYFTPWGSEATANFVAMMAQAARDFRPYDPTFADRCLQAAQLSYRFLKAHPEYHKADQTGFSTGAYETNTPNHRLGDVPNNRLWAEAELWETTGDPNVLRDLETRVRAIQGQVNADFDWDEVKDLGLFRYLSSQRPGRDRDLVTRVRGNVLGVADGIVQTRNRHGYARPLGSEYFWGCNGAVARQTLVLRVAYRQSPKPEYIETCLDALNHLFGRNCHGRSYVTGLGYLPPMNPHDRRSGENKVGSPWPGYLVGGPHPKAANWQDIQADFRTNEIAINWNGALIYALAAFVDASGK